MQAYQTSTTTDEARGHSKDQKGSGEATEGRVLEHSNLLGLDSQHSSNIEKGWKSQNVRGLSGSEPSQPEGQLPSTSH